MIGQRGAGLSLALQFAVTPLLLQVRQSGAALCATGKPRHKTPPEVERACHERLVMYSTSCSYALRSSTASCLICATISVYACCQ